MTDIDLDAIEARAMAVTPDAWETDGESGIVRCKHSDVVVANCGSEYDGPATAVFIAHAGSYNGDVLRLVAEVRRLRTGLASLRETMRQMVEDLGGDET